jgi:hypothetical protein
VVDAEALERLRQQVRQVLGLRRREHLGRRMGLASQLRSELLQDDRCARAVVHDGAIEVEDDDGHRLARGRSGALHDAREERVLLGGRDSSVRGAHREGWAS